MPVIVNSFTMAFMPAILHPWIAVAVTLLCFLGFQLRRGMPSDFLFLLGMLIVVITGVISPEDALAAFANPAIITVAALYIVSAGMRSTGALDWVGEKLLGTSQTDVSATRRLACSLVPISAFLLNTPLVAMAMPVVLDWCRRRNVSPSRLLLFVSYFAILGGVCTLIGTSTTLVVSGIVRQSQAVHIADYEKLPSGSPERIAAEKFSQGLEPLGFLEIGVVGIPIAIVGTLYLVFVGRRFLPNRTDLIELLGEQRREYLVEMQVRADCRLIGQSVESAGLRNLPGLFLIEIERDGDIITPVSPIDRIRLNDRLVFTGVVNTIIDLEKIPGLVPAADIAYEIHPKTRQQRHLTEVVLSRTSPLIGNTVKEANFRQVYNAAVVAVHRNGVRLTNKIGNIELEPGDVLLLQTRQEFVNTFRNSRDFYLVSDVDGDSPRRHDMALVASGLLLTLIVWLTCASLFGKGAPPAFAGIANPAIAALTVAALMVFSGCIRVSDARNALDLNVMVTIAASLTIGLALAKSGAAALAATWLLDLVGPRPYLILIAVYLCTLISTEFISNAAAAAMMFPMAVAAAEEGGFSPRPFIIGIALAASLGFLTPIGYQTNLMVMGPGGYRPIDYVRVGWPLSAITTTVALILIPILFPFFV